MKDYYVPTMKLRWIKREKQVFLTIYESKVLQQWWTLDERRPYKESSGEWRDVEVNEQVEIID